MSRAAKRPSSVQSNRAATQIKFLFFALSALAPHREMEAPPMVQDDFDDTDVFEQLDVSIAEMENNTVFSLFNFLLSGSPSKQLSPSLQFSLLNFHSK